MLDAMLTRSQEELPVPDTGTLRGDLIAFARLVAAYLATPLGTALSRTMAVADDDPDMADGRLQFWRARYDIARVMIDRAIERHELVAGTDSQLALELLIAPLHFRALLTRQPIDDTMIEQLVDSRPEGIDSYGAFRRSASEFRGPPSIGSGRLPPRSSSPRSPSARSRR